MTTVIPKTSKLSSLVHRVLGCNPGPMTLQGTNTYLVGDGARRLLIDTGEVNVPEYCHHLQRTLQDESCSIKDIVVTHWHHDHIGGVPDVLNLMKTPVPVHKYPREEDGLIDGLKLKSLQDGDLLKSDGATCKVYHTPGHTSDHVILHLQEENAVFSADCILGEGTAVFESLFHYMKSLEKILELQPSIIYPGHGPVVNDPIPKIQYYIKHRLEREKQILNCLQSANGKGLSSMDIVKSVYKATPENLWKAAQVNVIHHLEKLQMESKVCHEKDVWKPL